MHAHTCNRWRKNLQTWPSWGSNPRPPAQNSNTLPRRNKSRLVPQGSTSMLYTPIPCDTPRHATTDAITHATTQLRTQPRTQLRMQPRTHATTHATTHARNQLKIKTIMLLFYDLPFRTIQFHGHLEIYLGVIVNILPLLSTCSARTNTK